MESRYRRAKIITLVSDKKILDDFCKKVWTSGLTDKGTTRIKYFKDLVIRFRCDQEGIISDEEESDEISGDESEFAYEKDNYVVIELKVSRGYEKVVGQTLFYQSSIKTIFKQNKVRAIIIAREITSELKTATNFLSDFELFEYELSLTLNKIK